MAKSGFFASSMPLRVERTMRMGPTPGGGSAERLRIGVPDGTSAANSIARTFGNDASARRSGS